MNFHQSRDLTEEQAHRCRKLAASVLLTAIQDAAGPKDPRHAPEGSVKNQREAIRWFDQAGKGFRQICEMAGLDHAAVQERWKSGKIMDFMSKDKRREIPVLKFIQTHPRCTASRINRTIPNISPVTIVPMMADLVERGLLSQAKLRNTQAYTLTEAGIAHLQRAGGQPQREVGILQGDGAGKQAGPLVGKFEGVK